jgi:RNA polymerase sigma factor (sigma-70 family)
MSERGFEDTDPVIIDPVALGRQNYEEGKYFEQRVAELYRLQEYDVEQSRAFAGRQVDLFLTRRIGDLTLTRIVECKAGAVRSEHIDSFLGKLQVARLEYPSIHGTIISDQSFTDAVKAQAAALGIQLTLYRDLAANLFDGHKYANRLIREIETNSRYRMPLYVEPLIGYETDGTESPALSVLREWLSTPEWNQFTLLGDVGTGKSFLSRIFAYNQAQAFLRQPTEVPLPILIDLRNADRQFSLEGLILTHLAQTGLSGVSFEIFQFALNQGHITLILDGFDEMAARVTPQITIRNFHELARSVQGQAKVLLTCRTHYFKSKSDEESVVLGKSQEYDSDAAKELYWELISRKGFKIGYLRPFRRSQVENYVKQAKGPDAPAALTKIRSTYNLMELSHRPMLLEMIVKSLDKLTTDDISAATLYKVYTDAWIHRDQWRDVLSPEAKLSLVTAIAQSLWNQDVPAIHYSQLEIHLRAELADRVQDPRQFIEIDSEIRTASFLTRDDAGNYGFAHKSYMEFFVAHHVAQELKAGNVECLNIRRLTPEVLGFIRDMVPVNRAENLLESILTAEYRRAVSENALICLYTLRLGNRPTDRAAEEDTSVRQVALPENMKLSTAELDQIVLENARLQGADFSGAQLTQANFNRVVASNSSFAGATLNNASLVAADFTSSTFRNCSAKAINAEQANFHNANFANADLSDAYLLNSDWSGVQLSDTILIGAVLPEGADTSIATFWGRIEELRPRMLSFARAYGVNPTVDIEDIVSDVAYQLAHPRFLYQFISLDVLSQLQLATNMIRRRLLDNSRSTSHNVQLSAPRHKRVIEESIEDLILVAPDEHTLDRIYTEEVLAHLRAQLAPLTFSILSLRYADELTVDEIAQKLNLSKQSVHRHIRKARDIAREFAI